MKEWDHRSDFLECTWDDNLLRRSGFRHQFGKTDDEMCGLFVGWSEHSGWWKKNIANHKEFDFADYGIHLAYHQTGGPSCGFWVGQVMPIKPKGQMINLLLGISRASWMSWQRPRPYNARAIFNGYTDGFGISASEPGSGLLSEGVYSFDFSQANIDRLVEDQTELTQVFSLIQNSQQLKEALKFFVLADNSD